MFSRNEHRGSKMVKAKTKATKKVAKKTSNPWDGEVIAANIRKNAEEISANIQANAKRISDNIHARMTKGLK